MSAIDYIKLKDILYKKVGITKIIREIFRLKQ
jgi:hypothetical protein